MMAISFSGAMSILHRYIKYLPFNPSNILKHYHSINEGYIKAPFLPRLSLCYLLTFHALWVHFCSKCHTWVLGCCPDQYELN